MALYVHTFPSPIGPLTLCADEQALLRLSFGEIAADAQKCCTPLLALAQQQLEEYFRKTRQNFTLPLDPQGTDFQKRVWRALCAVPYGQTCSYAQLAAAVGSPRGFRAVGQANHVNPIAIMIPCHRVLRSDGNIGGYAGGIEIKKRLLELEACK